MRSTATAAAWSPGWKVRAILELEFGDVLRLRKSHPCGGTDWEVVRLGADIGLRCLGCGRRILIARPDLERRLKQIVGHRPIEAAADLSPDRFLRSE